MDRIKIIKKWNSTKMNAMNKDESITFIRVALNDLQKIVTFSRFTKERIAMKQRMCEIDAR